jgi:hypothetical protein
VFTHSDSDYEGNISRWVSRELTETIEVIYYYIDKMEEFLCKFWEIWNKEIDRQNGRIPMQILGNLE